ncbi:beta-1,3-galactosyltransferase 2-like [Danio rerio]|uniref:Hexosyltransferase n=1 Tax=Danio rerio TaxID=7955 RepID=B3DK15_DANRE|nr:beta-1,3-galactosyltransferase 2-like [Danio rerio]AAI63686.1 Similar to UDP-Gal:betaGlcNAc beta 1,3-galactosyltransferase 2 [Danio rerio]AAI63693.1 Similar to UDP-Gal:betaGlcNAc beta 1,3-galactosyltransferase 2 [Danio rerio]|eukprot:NP_001122198.1 beta-1,3-galactosyltransferase 2-like [Danio rerio]
MVQDGEDLSHGKSIWGLKSLRSLGIFMVLLVLCLCYYILPYEFSDTWTSTVGLFIKDDNVSLTTPSAVTTQEPWKPPEPYCVAYPGKYHFIVNEPEKCQKENPFVVLLIPVAPSNKAARDAVRSTWGTEKLVGDKVVTLLFLLGVSTSNDSQKLHEDLLKESEQYHDIVQSDFWDSYYNLTIKTMIMMEWLTAYCQNTSYVMKVDSDIFLNVKNLVNLLQSAPKQNYMSGLVARGAVVLRNPNSKWYLPKTTFAPDFYPPYALGLGYVFSIDLSQKLVEAAQLVKPVYIEDVYLGLCMQHLRIGLTNPPNGGLFNVFPVDYNRCRYSKLVATTTRSLNDQVVFWKELQKPGPYC